MKNLGLKLNPKISENWNRDALFVKGKYLTYKQIVMLGNDIYSHFSPPKKWNKRVGILSEKSEFAYASILGAVLRGYTYVPLNLRFPPARNAEIIENAKLEVVLCDKEGEEQLRNAKCNTQMITSSNLNPSFKVDELPESDALSNEYVYIMYTSGSTGKPKGVPITHENLLSYMSFMEKALPLSRDDKVSNTFEFSFDMSVHDLFMTWSAGACLYSFPDGMNMFSDRFIKDLGITIFYCVPSAGSAILKQGSLQKLSFQKLRRVMFVGEALPYHVAKGWQEASPNAEVYNLYGPTETTITVSHFHWKGQNQDPVPLGEMYDHLKFMIVDESLNPVPKGEKGELLVSGSQVAKGYLENPSQSSEKFIKVRGSHQAWYRTGDIVSEDSRFGLLYLGRADQQMKIKGFRVEGLEVESKLRMASGSNLSAVIGWPRSEHNEIKGLVGFVCNSSKSETEIIRICRESLPEYMVPFKIINLEEAPLNSNGKLDRNALIKYLENVKEIKKTA